MTTYCLPSLRDLPIPPALVPGSSLAHFVLIHRVQNTSLTSFCLPRTGGFLSDVVIRSMECHHMSTTGPCSRRLLHLSVQLTSLMRILEYDETDSAGK